MRLNENNSFIGINPPYQLSVIHSSKLIYPREIYQRGVERKRVELIARDFNEYIVNEPKVSFRNGKHRHSLSRQHKSNIGLLPFGDVGTGKSFFAGCIANALLDRDVPVLMTNFPTILNRLTGMFSEDRSEFIASFDEYDLLIIDDLGVERSTEYAMEQMFFVIDSRYRSRRPMIITTNLKLSELKNPPDLAHARIYDRILERCAPILFDGKNFREENAGATRQTAKDIVSSKQD